MDLYQLKSNKFNIKDWDPNDRQLFEGNKEAGLALLQKLKARLHELQLVFFAEKKHKVLLVLQGMDTSGKDGTIRHVFGGLDPQGIQVASFGKPSALELSHDYMWRIHKHAPSNGIITIFNRSHYEEVLAVRVRNLKPKSVWSKRFNHINNYEQMLTDEGVIIIKIFLNINQEEQKKRLIGRLNNPQKHWKLIPDDIQDRKLWPSYVEAYDDAIEKTNTSYAPWHIIPANKKWYRNIVVAQLMVDQLEALDSKFPEPTFDPATLVIE